MNAFTKEQKQIHVFSCMLLELSSLYVRMKRATGFLLIVRLIDQLKICLTGTKQPFKL